jgi:hypothetical protein
MSTVLIFATEWKKWYRVLRYHKGFGLFDSVRFGLWLARGGEEASPAQTLTDEVRTSA